LYRPPPERPKPGDRDSQDLKRPDLHWRDLTEKQQVEIVHRRQQL